MNYSNQLQDAVASLRMQLLNHHLYSRLHSLESIQVFMQHHVFAVWDFMSLLKSLQASLTVTRTPWTPPSNAAGCRLINEITLAEESDEDGRGGYVSHFEMYVRAMTECRADTTAIRSVVEQIDRGTTWLQALRNSSAPAAVHDFLKTTFEIIDRGNVCAVASAFTFGREDLLPEVFREIVSAVNSESSVRLDQFEYYLQRHIELDGDQHGGMAHRLMEELCGSEAERWDAAQTAAIESLEARLQLWDAIAEQIDAAVPEPFLAGLS